ncbi:hypothetical protein NEOLEDRAFT_1221723, partial [Neolentinus lepideus HHB14362 ss-1]
MLRNSPDLQGYSIPGIKDKILITLFADDTTIYLKQTNCYNDLQTILTCWCCASGAKFNAEKTEIIPIGTETHCSLILANRQLHPDDAPLPLSIHIAKDGEAICSLGAWIGNNVNNISPWEPVIDKISLTLSRFQRSHPTLTSKTIMVQWSIGGMSQYLAKVHGMPQNIEDALEKLTHAFIWTNPSHPPISLNQLYKDKSHGGIGLLDIHSRNEAIELTWLCEYLDISPSRPAWAFVVNILINQLAPEGIPDQTRLNTFLQKWDIPTRGRCASTLPVYALVMLRTAKCYGTSFAPAQLSQRLKCQMPTFYH